tara:strand:+ start:495 stop:686 length:192 start_codon:yes stop_codon:yes gene_type:complete
MPHPSLTQEVFEFISEYENGAFRSVIQVHFIHLRYLEDDIDEVINDLVKDQRITCKNGKYYID